MRVVLFAAGGLFSTVLLDALAGRLTLDAVVVPQPAGPAPRRLAAAFLVRTRSRDFRKRVRRLGLPRVPYRRDGVEQVAAALAPLRPDLLLIGSFPFVLPRIILALPRLGTVNLHPSLLPRHRGVDPVYWTFAGDDLETGVTLHWVDATVDGGDVIARRSIPVDRGVTGSDLTVRLAREAGELLLATWPALESGTAPRHPQDEALATREPTPSRAPWPVDYAAWPAERVWHFLRGAGTSRLKDGSGRALLAGAAVSYGTGRHEKAPGSAVEGPAGLRLYCRDGWVDLAPPSLKRRIARAVTPLLRGRTGPVS